MILFINDPGQEFSCDIRKLLTDKKISMIPLKVNDDANKDEIEKSLNAQLKSGGIKEVSIIIFHPAIRVNMVPTKKITLVVGCIKKRLNNFLVTISADPGNPLSFAEQGGADVVLPITRFYEGWTRYSGNEDELLKWLGNYAKGEKTSVQTNNILTLVLPLDIDMQALVTLPEDKQFNYLQKMIEEVNELITEEGRERDFYSAKLKKANQLLEQIPDNPNKDKVKELLCINGKQKKKFISDFVKNLDDCLLNDENYDSHLQEIVKQNEHNQQKSKASQFVDWYRDLDRALKNL